MKYKIGDKVKLVNCYYDDDANNPIWDGIQGKIIGIVDDLFAGSPHNIGVKWENGRHNVYLETDLELINNDSLVEDVTISSKESTKTMINLKENFLLAVTPEPMKSFRKAGITNGDNLLTDEGQKIFLTWLLGKNQEEFKKEIVDNILEQDK